MTTDAELKTIDDAIHMRGLFVQRYSGIEFALTELIMRAREHSAYNALGDLPWKFESKLMRLEALITADGPIAEYASDVRSTLGNFTEFAERRHFMVHGIMVILRDAVDRTTLCFHMYDHKKVMDEGVKKSVVHLGTMNATLEQLDSLAVALQPISTGFTELVARICREVPLPLSYGRIED
jgi:hypothetical protein